MLQWTLLRKTFCLSISANLLHIPFYHFRIERTLYFSILDDLNSNADNRSQKPIQGQCIGRWFCWLILIRQLNCQTIDVCIYFFYICIRWNAMGKVFFTEVPAWFYKFIIIRIMNIIHNNKFRKLWIYSVSLIAIQINKDCTIVLISHNYKSNGLNDLSKISKSFSKSLNLYTIMKR